MTIKVKCVALFLFCFSQLTFSQEWKDIETAKKEITTLFAKADKKNLQNLLPYIVDNKTGFIDAKAKKIIVAPTAKITEATLFNPKMTGTYKGEYSFEIDPWGFLVHVKKTEPQQTFEVMGVEPGLASKIEIISSENGYKGFKVDEDGKLVAYSDLYKAMDVDHFNVIPFLYKGNYYAKAVKKTGPDEYYSGIIDTAGNTIPHFDFIHHGIQKIDLLNNDGKPWFVVGAIRNYKGSLMSFDGDVKLKDELVSYPYFGAFGYSRNAPWNDTLTGILDFINLKWVIKPQSKIRIIEVTYVSKERLDESSIESRKKAKMYFRVLDKNKQYYMDFNMVKYFPGK